MGSDDFITVEFHGDTIHEFYYFSRKKVIKQNENSDRLEKKKDTSSLSDAIWERLWITLLERKEKERKQWNMREFR